MGLSNKNPKDWVLDVNDNLPLDDKTYYFRVGDPSLAIHLFTKNKLFLTLTYTNISKVSLSYLQENY